VRERERKARERERKVRERERKARERERKVRERERKAQERERKEQRKEGRERGTEESTGRKERQGGREHARQLLVNTFHSSCFFEWFSSSLLTGSMRDWKMIPGDSLKGEKTQLFRVFFYLYGSVFGSYPFFGGSSAKSLEVSMFRLP
jgi:hypothetical protein